MADLEIPQAAVAALHDVVGDSNYCYGFPNAAAHRIAAPVVAAELRKIADLIRPQYSVEDGSDAMTRRACVAAILARADELEGTGRQQRLDRFIGSVSAGPDFASVSSPGEVNPDA